MKKIIYIAGTGKSRSTLLDIILRKTDNVFSVGELNHLFKSSNIYKTLSPLEFLKNYNN